MTNATSKLLEQHFDTAFSAPNGVKKLRELILTLAMQGKLVPQDPNDQPASELLKEIVAEKERLVKEGKIKKQKPLPEITDEEKPYQLPHGWEWVRLVDISVYNGRKNIDSESIADDTWLLDLEDIEKETSKLLCNAKFYERQSKSTKSTFVKGDVLYGKLRPYLDKVIVADQDGVCTTEIVPIIPLCSLNAHFLRLLLKRSAFLKYVNELMYGVKMPRLGTEQAENSTHPLPPLAEQQRIVAKIDELMAKCDALEALQQAQATQRTKTHQAAIQQLLTADDTPTAWQFLKTHFETLYQDKENVKELRKAILQLAVMGKLVPQDLNDQPASELLKEIAAEKERLVKEGKIKKQKPLPAIGEDEKPYQLPKGWEWVRLGEISHKIHYGYTASANEQIKSIRLLRITDIQENQVDWETVPGCDAKKDDVLQYILNNNDILIARTGGTVGKSYLVTNICVDAVFASYLIRVIPSQRMLPIYVKYFLETPLYWTQLYSACSGTGQPNVNGTSLTDLYFPLPPLAEQQRIVAKIDQLMALCDQLETQIDERTGKQSELLAAVMSEV